MCALHDMAFETGCRTIGIFAHESSKKMFDFPEYMECSSFEGEMFKSFSSSWTQ